LARPPILSYAQNAEDVVLSRAFADQEFGLYVDIGAYHPVEDSVTLHFYERGWRGVNVEPDRELHALFVEARPRDTNLCAAVTAQPAIAQLRAPWNGGRLGVSGPLISSKAFSLPPSSLRNSR
jgi:uncharacterized membrane protein